MSNKKRVNLMLDENIVDMLDSLSDGERKRSRWVSEQIQSAYAAKKQNADVETMDLDGLRLLVMGVNARMTTLEGRMQQTDATVAALVAKGA